jgi:hypothetical protein
MQRAESLSVRLKTDELARLKRWAESRDMTLYEASRLAIRTGLKSLGVIEAEAEGDGGLASTEAVSLLANVLAQVDGLSELLQRVDRRVAWTTHAAIAGSLAARQHLKLVSPEAFDAAEGEGRKVMEDLGVYRVE